MIMSIPAKLMCAQRVIKWPLLHFHQWLAGCTSTTTFQHIPDSKESIMKKLKVFHLPDMSC